MRKIRMFLGIVFLAFIIPAVVFANDFSDYGTNGQRYDIELPEITYGWFMAIDFFPAGTTGNIGNYEAEGRVLCANNKTLYLQQNYGTSKWVPVATVTGNGMDPSFIHISPDGNTVALGKGYGQELLVFPTSILDPDNPPVLDTNAQTKSYPNVSYYDAEWLGNRYLLVNGLWTDVEVRYVDVINDPLTTAGTILIDTFPGSSADVTVDNFGNVITGDGYSASTTGEIRLFTSAEIQTAIATSTPLAYDTAGDVLANRILSAAGMGVDIDNNLHVAGGNWLQTGEQGFIAIVSGDVLSRVASGSSAVDEGLPVEYKELRPDSCEDDTAMFATYSTWSGGLAVMWNPSEDGTCKGAGSDYWQSGVVPVLSIYYPDSAPDSDADTADGIPDGSDNAYLTANSGQEDTDDDGWANIADADFDNDNDVDPDDRSILISNWGIPTNNAVDMNSDGIVNPVDLSLFNSRLNTQYPWY